jgi:uncharacterized metal-binding protein
MPSGKTHDFITLILAIPTFGAAFAASKDMALSITITSGMLFGGLMFGPDLDTISKPYARWGFFRLLWYPYQACFSHRSRWSHGLIFGSLFRVIYFFGVITLLSFLAFYLYSLFAGNALPDLIAFAKIWQAIGGMLLIETREFFAAGLFTGIWLGAASHTFTDMAGTFIKTGRVTEFL